MPGTVTEFFDPHALPLPDGEADVSVTPQELAAHHARLALVYGAQVPADRAAPGDCVLCLCEDAQGPLAGRAVPLYPGQGFPQAPEAEAAAVGKAPGDRFSAPIDGRLCALRVERITRVVPAPVDDALVLRLGNPQVTTLAQYDAHYRAEEESRRLAVLLKTVTTQLLRDLTGRCRFAYDADALEVRLTQERERLAAQGLELPDDQLREMLRERLDQNLVLRELCRRAGTPVTEADVKDSVDQMLEMMALMGEPVPDREALTREYIEGETYTRGFALLKQVAREKLEAAQ